MIDRGCHEARASSGAVLKYDGRLYAVVARSRMQPRPSTRWRRATRSTPLLIYRSTAESCRSSSSPAPEALRRAPGAPVQPCAPRATGPRAPCSASTLTRRREAARRRKATCASTRRTAPWRSCSTGRTTTCCASPAAGSTSGSTRSAYAGAAAGRQRVVLRDEAPCDGSRGPSALAPWPSRAGLHRSPQFLEGSRGARRPRPGHACATTEEGRPPGASPCEGENVTVGGVGTKRSDFGPRHNLLLDGPRTSASSTSSLRQMVGAAHSRLRRRGARPRQGL